MRIRFALLFAVVAALTGSTGAVVAHIADGKSDATRVTFQGDMLPARFEMAVLNPDSPPASQQAAACDNTVHPGESLSVVAARCGVTWQRLFDANPQLADPDHVPSGQVRVPAPDEQLPHRELRPAAPAVRRSSAHQQQQYRAVSTEEESPEATLSQPDPQPIQGFTSPAQARAIGQRLAAKRGWVGSEWRALDRLWSNESGWCMTRWNGYHDDCLSHWTAPPPHSSEACGIPQSWPCKKMADYGDFRNNATIQINWGLDYIEGKYGRPSNAPLGGY